MDKEDSEDPKELTVARGAFVEFNIFKTYKFNNEDMTSDPINIYTYNKFPFSSPIIFKAKANYYFI